MRLAERGDIDRAMALAQKAKAAIPGEPQFSDTLGWIYYQRGLYARAVDLLKESARQLRDDPLIQYHLGMAQLKLGDAAAGRQSLERALRLSRAFPGAREAEAALAEFRPKG